MGISGIPNPEELSASSPNLFRPGWWVGWHIGWWTGWWNPFDWLKEIDPRVVGRLTEIQGEFLARQVEVLTKQAELIQEMGRNIAETGGIERKK
jgi:hypothetical protein